MNLEIEEIKKNNSNSFLLDSRSNNEMYDDLYKTQKDNNKFNLIELMKFSNIKICEDLKLIEYYNLFIY